MKKNSLILFGAGGHAESCIDVIEQHGEFKISGLVGKREELGIKLSGYEVIATDEDVFELSKEFANTLIAVGQIGSSEHRTRLFKQAKAAGFTFPGIVSPFAYVSPKAKIGHGTIVLHAAVVNAGVSVGENCIVNSRALLEHGSQVQNHCHISTGAIINGGVFVGEGTFVGSGSVVRERVSIGERSVIGMGTTLRNDLPPNSTFLGDSQL